MAKLRYLAGILILLAAVAVEFFTISQKNTRTFIIVITIILSSLPFIISIIISQKRQTEKEERFLEFSRDLVESTKSGTPIVKAILNVQKKDYGTLTPHIQKLASQLTLGITLNDALQTLARESGSRVIARAVALISEAERAGGKIETILESVANSVNQIESLKKERKSSIANLITQGYIIFIVFIIIMLILEFKILPLVSDVTAPSDNIKIKARPLAPQDFSKPLFIMLIIQSLFAGIVIGKISEGSIKYGIKHSFILLSLTLLVKTGANAFFG
ncbi:hypothetical protein D6829_02740 [Candidatus Pacearchaeota archaeon]|nr:MAG: hypothetical protein D6829_02740 [Candidatus Pacearchaeota archaeon]